VPLSFDSATEVLVVPDTIDLSLVRPAHILVDAKDEEYLITEVSGQTITIVLEGGAPDTSKVKITSFIKTQKIRQGQSYVEEQIDIGIHGHAEQNTVLWMYYMVIWICLRFKQELEHRGIDLSTWSATDFKRDSQYLGENIFSRWMRVTARTLVTWKDETYTSLDTLVDIVEVEDET
jgi:hypothetical protein